MALRGQADAFERQLKAAAGNFSDTIPTAIAADFLHGGAPGFARIFDRRGRRLATIRRLTDEPWAAFRDRVRDEVGKTAQAACSLVGGLPEDGLKTDRNLLVSTDPPRGAIILPETPLHPSQVEALDLIRGNRRVVLVCGRRWGKSSLLVALAVDAALSGQRVGIFAPTRTLLSPLLHAIAHALRGVKGVSINRMFGEIRLPNGAHVDFWSIDHTQRAGRGRAYHLALIDEAGHDETYLTDGFQVAIAPTLLDFAGSIVEASTPNGVSPENHFWRVAHLAEMGFVVHHAPTNANPHLPVEEIAVLRATMRPEEAAQELDALFVDMAGVSIFPLAALLEDGQRISLQCQLESQTMYDLSVVLPHRSAPDDRRVRVPNGGRVDFWSIDHKQRAGLLRLQQLPAAPRTRLLLPAKNMLRGVIRIPGEAGKIRGLTGGHIDTCLTIFLLKYQFVTCT